MMNHRDTEKIETRLSTERDPVPLWFPLIAILIVYAALGVLYAVHTPAWQVPDEPAHYNYIRFIAEQGALPVLEAGDYDQAYLERLTGERFPPELSIEPVNYEDHQPPLYYLLAAPLFRLFDGALLPLRLFSVALGALLLTIVYRLVRVLFPHRPTLALIAAGLIALLPQHLAMTAGVNNDALAEVVLAATLLTALRYLQPPSSHLHPPTSILQPLPLGLLVGLALLTKTTAYGALPVALLAVGLRIWRTTDHGPRTTHHAPRTWQSLLPVPLILGIALLLAGPWLACNVAVYGWSDPLGLARHNAVVVGQPRSAEWLALYGWGGLVVRFVRTTFQSFWGQFGWMGVPLHPPVYRALALFSALLVGGFLGWLFDRRRPRPTRPQADGLLLLAFAALWTAATYLGYNLTFVQHQGRYLFPALVPLALGAALGLDWLSGWIRPRWGRALALTAVAAGLVALNLYAIFMAIVPMLAR